MRKKLNERNLYLIALIILIVVPTTLLYISLSILDII